MGNSFIYSMPGGLFFTALFIWLNADRSTHMGRATRFTGSVFFSLFTLLWLLTWAHG